MATVADVRAGRRAATRGWAPPSMHMSDVVGAVWMVVLLAFAVIPMLWMLSTSLKGQFAALQQPPEWIPSHPTLEQYQTLLSPTGTIGPVFLRYFLNSMIVSLTTTELGVFIAIPAAYAFSRSQFPGRDILFFAGLVCNMSPVVVFL